MKKAFITGATGFIGLNLIERLLEKNWDVTTLHLPGEDLRYLSRFSAKQVVGNILDSSTLLAVIPESCDVVFHLAGDTSTWPKEADRQYRINVDGTTNVCRAAIQKKVGRLVLTSSSSAYGYHATPISEQTASNALSCGMNYHATKFLAEQETLKLVEQGLDAVIVNPCNLIGPYDQHNWSQLIIAACTGKMPGYPPGSGTFAHVRDIADAHIAAAEKGRTGENYLLGGVEASFREVIDEIAAVTGNALSLEAISKNKLKFYMHLSNFAGFITRREPMMTYPKYMRLVGRLSCDCSKAVRELDFKTTSIREMVADAYQWLKQEGRI